jgi:hypothetical protein
LLSAIRKRSEDIVFLFRQRYVRIKLDGFRLRLGFRRACCLSSNSASNGTSSESLGIGRLRFFLGS